jgi:hypothetical protein
VVPAVVAGIGGAAVHAVVLVLNAALRALGNAAWPALLLDVLKAGIVVGKLFVEIPNGVAEFLRDALFDFHCPLTATSVA